MASSGSLHYGNSGIDLTTFLPTTIKEMEKLGWDYVDVILFSGDAYIDHPSFGTAVIARVLESIGLRVAVVPQPNWQDDLRDFKKFGRPRLFFGVSAGNMDSMLNHYTAFRRKRSTDAYTPGNRAGARPDYPTIVYTKILKELYPDIPVIIGGIEASLRRLTHYDYWQDSLKGSILHESGADLLVYGMGEKAITDIVRLMEKGIPFHRIDTVPQTAIWVNSEDDIPKNKHWRTIELHSHEDCLKDSDAYAENFTVIETESNKMEQARLIQKAEKGYIIVNPASTAMTEEELDHIYSLPYTRKPHPRYRKKEPIPAFDMVKDSITLHRGCFGGCSFCTISAHQGKFITSRSRQSIMDEVKKIAESEDFHGHITDLGGPSANMYAMAGRDIEKCRKCTRASCIFPNTCNNLNADLSPLIAIYREARNTEGVNNVSIGSGIRYDIMSNRYLQELLTHHVSGRLKVAPEHTENHILELMRKPPFKEYQKFRSMFDKISEKIGKRQQLIPYLISSHPGCREEDMAELAIKIKGTRIDQVQDFTPTPMTLSAVMYYTGKDPYSGKSLSVSRSIKEKRAQKDYFFINESDKRRKLFSRLSRMGRNDIVERMKKG